MIQKLWNALLLLSIVQATSPLLSLLQQEHDELLESITDSRPEYVEYREIG